MRDKFRLYTVLILILVPNAWAVVPSDDCSESTVLTNLRASVGALNTAVADSERFKEEKKSAAATIFEQKCLRCHRSGPHKFEAKEFRDSAALLKASRSGAIWADEIVKRILIEEGEPGAMPPTGALTQAERDAMIEYLGLPKAE